MGVEFAGIGKLPSFWLESSPFMNISMMAVEARCQVH